MLLLFVPNWPLAFTIAEGVYEAPFSPGRLEQQSNTLAASWPPLFTYAAKHPPIPWFIILYIHLSSCLSQPLANSVHQGKAKFPSKSSPLENHYIHLKRSWGMVGGGRWCSPGVRVRVFHCRSKDCWFKLQPTVPLRNQDTAVSKVSPSHTMPMCNVRLPTLLKVGNLGSSLPLRWP